MIEIHESSALSLLKLYTPQQLHRAAYRARLQRDFYSFVLAAWPIIEPGQPLIDNWHLGAICDHLAAVARGEIQKLLINIPPGFAKSIITCVMWPAWIWTWRPDWRGIFTSYAGTLASRDSHKCRTILESPWYVETFSEPAGWDFDPSQNEKTFYQNTKTGFRQSFSVGTGTGFRGNAVVTDDPLCADDQHSKPKRDEVIFWWDQTMSNRVNNPERDAFVIIMQRLHNDDLSGHVLKRGDYEHLCLPMEYDPKRSFVTFRTVGGKREVFAEDKRTEAGELLFPQRFSQELLDREGGIKEVLGSDGVAGQLQQNPNPPGGSIFKKEWWRFFSIKGRESAGYPRPKGCLQIEVEDEHGIFHKVDIPAVEVDINDMEELWISVDCSFKDKKDSSYVVFGLWGRIGRRRFRIARRRGKMSYTRTKQELSDFCAEWPRAYKKLIEDKANGPAIINDLSSEIAGLLPRNPKGSKEERAHAISPQCESGHVFLLDGEPWLEEWTSEMSAFPFGSNDDQVDETSQALLEYAPNGATARAAALCDTGLRVA